MTPPKIVSLYTSHTLYKCIIEYNLLDSDDDV
jgi:hypothetical protein